MTQLIITSEDSFTEPHEPACPMHSSVIHKKSIFTKNTWANFVPTLINSLTHTSLKTEILNGNIQILMQMRNKKKKGKGGL